MTKKIKPLFEDLKPGDLKDLVGSIIEIDAYESRISDENITVSFRVDSEFAAHDLSRFIEFSNKSVLDTEVSSFPNQDSDYTVYVEFSHDNLAKKIVLMLNAVKHLTGISTWTYKAYGKKGKIKL